MSHKTAEQLKRDDLFNMAGNLFKVLDTTDVSVDHMIRVHFQPVSEDPFKRVRCHMTIPRDTLFHLH